MKKVILLMMLTTSIFTSSCSNDSNETTNPEIPKLSQFNVTLTGKLKTDYCDIFTNSYAVEVEYISDSEITDIDEWNGTTQESISGNAILSGNIIGVRVKLTNFNSDNSDIGRGTGFDTIHLKIIDVESNELLLDQDRNEYLIICHDAIYEVLYLYNTNTGELTPTLQGHNF